MKNKQTIFKTVLLCAFTVLLFSCNKDVVEPTPQVWNYSTFTDTRDGKKYKFIKIGNQEWMAENLAFKTDSGSWFTWESEAEGTKFGRLYTWDAAIKAVPAGWHLPSDAEWKQLEINLGMSQSDANRDDTRGTTEGSKLKATSGWTINDNVSGNGTDEVGFSALPGGFRSNSGSYYGTGTYGYWWSATENDNLKAWIRYITYYRMEIYRSFSFKQDGYSVRCVKD